MKKIILILFFALFFVALNSQESELERYKRMQQQEIQQWKQERDSELEAYQARVEKERKEWQEYVNSVRAKWGEYTNTTPKQWSDYGKDLSSMSVVDFENNEVEVAALVEQDDPRKAQKIMKEQFIKMMNEREEGTNNKFMENQIAFEKTKKENRDKLNELQREFQQERDRLIRRSQEEKRALELKKKELEQKARAEKEVREKQRLLEEKRKLEKEQAEIAKKEREKRRQLEEKKSKEEQKIVKTVDSSNSEEFIEQAMKDRLKKEVVIGEDGRARTKFTLTLEMAPNSIQKRAENYIDMIIKHSDKYDLDISVVMALIHTESAFNPKAFSRRPDGTPMACGLMQIIPTMAGRDAHKALYGTDKIVEPEYLFDPENNLKMGTWYMNFLYRWWNRYEKRTHGKTSSKTKNEYYAIASYNQGMGTILNKAYKIHDLINKSDQETYKILTTERRIPEEGRNYLKRIEERKHIYRKTD
ncbi:MAG: transglycosylase SLT domain-containing protein [Candidatus Delongbacteria bacterium]